MNWRSKSHKCSLKSSGFREILDPNCTWLYSNSIRGVPDSNIRKIGDLGRYSNSIREYSYQNKYSYQNMKLIPNNQPH